MSRKSRALPVVARIFDGAAEARLIALACSHPPEGHARWSLRLLESKVAELGIVERANDSRSSARSKNARQPHRRQYWVIPPKASGAFVAAMEDVLEVYTRPRDPSGQSTASMRPQSSLSQDTRPGPAAPGRPARLDSEYVRNGTANLFMIYAPLEGWRHVKVTDRRAAIDYPGAEGPRRHSLSRRRQNCARAGQSRHPGPASLYEAFPAAEARRMAFHAQGGIHSITTTWTRS